MHSMLLAETAILVHFKSVRIVLLVLDSVVIALLAFSAGQCDFNSHFGTSVYGLIFCAKKALGWGFCRTIQPPSVNKITRFQGAKKTPFFEV